MRKKKKAMRRKSKKVLAEATPAQTDTFPGKPPISPELRNFGLNFEHEDAGLEECHPLEARTLVHLGAVIPERGKMWHPAPTQPENEDVGD
jgi:hypothetical protein